MWTAGCGSITGRVCVCVGVCVVYISLIMTYMWAHWAKRERRWFWQMILKVWLWFGTIYFKLPHSSYIHIVSSLFPSTLHFSFSHFYSSNFSLFPWFMGFPLNPVLFINGDFCHNKQLWCQTSSAYEVNFLYKYCPANCPGFKLKYDFFLIIYLSLSKTRHFKLYVRTKPKVVNVPTKNNSLYSLRKRFIDLFAYINSILMLLSVLFSF